MRGKVKRSDVMMCTTLRVSANTVLGATHTRDADSEKRENERERERETKNEKRAGEGMVTVSSYEFSRLQH